MRSLSPHWQERAAGWLILGGCVLCLPAGCLDIEETPGDPLAAGFEQDGSVDAEDSDAPEDADLPDVQLNQCTLDCASEYEDEDPEAAQLFLTLNICATAAVLPEGQCAAACEPGVQMDEPPSCPMPGTLNPQPSCNACVKDLCCPQMQACFNNTGCLTIGLCAQTCGVQN